MLKINIYIYFKILDGLAKFVQKRIAKFSNNYKPIKIMQRYSSDLFNIHYISPINIRFFANTLPLRQIYY